MQFRCSLLAAIFGTALLPLAACNGAVSPVIPFGTTGQSVESSGFAPSRGTHPPTFKSLYSFKGGSSDGTTPGGLTVLNGVIYGTTASGGGGYNAGTVFSITTSGKEKKLYSFHGRPNDGLNPGASSPVVLNGVLYGITSAGGNGPCRNGAGLMIGCGIVFSLTTSGQEEVVYNFQGGQDGAFPTALIADDGVLYGTTDQGGSNGCGGAGCGTVFSVTTSGQERVLYGFGTFSDGNYPNALIAVKRKLYGTTFLGGYCYYNGNGCGTFFSVTKSGRERVLYEFKGFRTRDGAAPQGALFDLKGTLFAVATSGGSGGLGFCDSPLGECGTAYSITTSGVENELHSFGGPYGDGSWPMGGVIAMKGVLYGTTYEGGDGARNHACHDRYGNPVGCGTVFSMTTSGQENVLYSFLGGADGGYPESSLVVVKHSLYGTTTLGGKNNLGSVFKVTP